MPRVACQDVDRNGGLRKGLRHDTARSTMESSIARFEVEAPYISILKRSHADQQATVSTDKESDMFKIQRVTKQGDP